MSIPELRISLDHETANDVRALVCKTLRPDWDLDKVLMERPSCGFLNLTYLLYSDQSRPTQGALVIKAFRPVFCGSVTDSKRIYTFLNTQGLSPDIHAFLDNGVCMSLVQGEAMDYDSPTIYHPQYRDGVARELAHWHCLSTYTQANGAGIRTTNITGCQYRQTWEDIFLEEPFKEYKQQLPTVDEIVEYYDRLEREGLENGDLEQRFIHQDVVAPNVFLTGDSQRPVQLIDFDFTGIGYVQYELASFFRCFKEVSEPGSDHIPGREYEMQFLSYYLKGRNRLDGLQIPTEKDIEILYNQIQRAKVMVNLRFIVLASHIMHYSKSQPCCEANLEKVEGGVLMYINAMVKMWANFTEHKERVYREYPTCRD